MISLLITILIVILFIYLIQTLLTMVDPPFRNILSIVVVVLALVWLFGLGGLPAWRH